MDRGRILEHTDDNGVRMEVSYEVTLVHEGLAYNAFVRDTLCIKLTWPDGITKVRMLRPGSASVIDRSTPWEVKRFTEQLIHKMRNQEEDVVIDG